MKVIAVEQDRSVLELYEHYRSKYGVLPGNYSPSLDVQEPGHLELSIKEQNKLIRQAANGRKNARRLLISQYINLIKEIARSYRRRGVSDEDLVQVAVFGLIVSYKKYDLEKYSNLKFSTYLRYWVHQKITIEIKKNGRNVRFPINQIEKDTKVRRFYKHLIEEGEKDPIGRIIDFTGMPESEIKRRLDPKIEPRIVTNNELLDGDSSKEGHLVTEDFLSSLYQPQSVEEKLEMEQRREQIDEAAERLSERERDVLYRRNGKNQEGIQESLSDIGKDYDVTRERVRQIEKRAIGKMRSELTWRKLKRELGKPPLESLIRGSKAS